MVLLCKRKQFLWAYTNVVKTMKALRKLSLLTFSHLLSIIDIIFISVYFDRITDKIVQSCPSKAVNNLNTPRAQSKYHTYDIGSITESLSEVSHGPKGKNLFHLRYF